MSKKTKLFEHEVMQDKASVIAYLKELIKGLEKGKITLADADEKITLTPPELMQLSLKGKRNNKGEELRFRLTWKHARSEKAPSLKVDSADD